MPNNIVKGFIPEIFDASIYRTYEDNLIFKKISKLTPSKGVQDAGDTVYFTDLADPSITDYTGTLTAENLKDSQIALLIDKEKTFCWTVKDEDQLMTNVDLKGSQADRSGYVLKRSVEVAEMQTVAGFAAAGTVTDATCDSATIIGDLALLQQYLAEQNVSEEDMWMVIPPWVRVKLQLAGIAFQINNGINGMGGMAWTNELGFDMYVTNTVYNSGTAAAPVSSVLAGSYQAIAYADKQLITRTTPLTNTRAIQVDGGLVYGCKVVFPKYLAKAVLTFAAETAI